jgi:hypothetical protein
MVTFLLPRRPHASLENFCCRRGDTQSTFNRNHFVIDPICHSRSEVIPSPANKFPQATLKTGIHFSEHLNHFVKILRKN